jgi:protein ImuB
MLWLCLGLPKLPLEIFTRTACADKRESLVPFVVSERQDRAQCVSIANDPAHVAGIRIGMPLADAHALAPGLQTIARDPIAEQAALERLAVWALQFTSYVHVVSSSPALLLEIEGSLKTFGSLDMLCKRLREGCAALGYSPVLAVAPTPLAATWFARAGDESPVTDLRILAGRLFEMPLHCFDFSQAQRELLQGMGLRTLGECLCLPRDGLARRLGAGFVVALDRAFGRLPDPRSFFTAPPSFEASLALPSGASSSERILFPLSRLMIELGGFLGARVAGAQTLELRLKHPKAACTRIDIGLTRATRDTVHLIELFRERLIRIVLPEPVEAMTLSVSQIPPLAVTAPNSSDAAKTKPDAAAELIERLSVRLGRQAVRGIAAAADHRPEHAWHYIEPGTPAAPQTKAIPRPLWLLPEPLPLEIRNGKPCLDGALEIEADRERIEPARWDGKDIRRDYFVARDAGGAWLWVYRELCANSRWWLHGVFG